MEEIIKGLEKNGRLRDTSCEAELQELLHQIDVMVNRKKVEWEQRSHSLETQLQMCEQELANAHTCLDSKQHEVDKLHQQLQDFENSHGLMIQKYEEQFNSLKSDLYQLHSTYGKLQKHQLKQAKETFKQQPQSSDAKLNNWKQIEICESEIKYLRTCVACAQETIRSDEASIEQMKSTIEQKTTQEELHQEEQQNLLEKIKCYQKRCQKMELKLSDLQTELESRDDLLQVNHLEQKQLRKELARVRQSIMQKDDFSRSMELTNLEMELKSTLKQLEASSQTEIVLQGEIMRLKAELDLTHTYCDQQKNELSRKDEELQILQNEYMEGNKEINKLRNCLGEKEQSHSSEMVGIRTEVSNLSTVLDQKEITIATVTEKTAHLEKQLKTEQENRDHISAEYWVAMDQLESLKAENKHLKEMLQTLEGQRAMIENNQLKELQNTYAASIHKLGYDNKLLQKDLVKLKAELEMSTRTSQEKYEAALRHTQHAVTEMKEHESRRVKKLQQENEKQMSTVESKLEETIQHYEEKIKNLQKNSFNISAPCFRSTESREYSLERNLAPTNIADNSFFHCNNVKNEPCADKNESDCSLCTVLTKESSLPLTPTEISDTSSVTEHFLEEEEERARVLEKLLNSHINELQADSKHTLQIYAGTKMDIPDSRASWCQCTCQDI